ncbi:MAG: hypothetical protein JXM70_11600 [Pirellulales bacterium]|nr:hypothetical protein [Pirellulales bacterium]
MLLRFLCAAICVAMAVTDVAGAGESTRGKLKCMGKFNADDKTVDFFPAIEKGQIRVRLIPRNARQARLMIDNQTEQPLNVRFPAAFAAVPVLAQWKNWQQGGPGIVGPNNQLGQGNNQPGQMQQIGGPFQGPGNPVGNNGPLMNIGNPNAQPLRPGGPMFGPVFNIAPENIGHMKLDTVCLDHGKPNPRPKAKYEIRPVEQVCQKSAVVELLRMMSDPKVDRQAAQAAAWHLNNGKTWKQLADMKKNKLLPVDPFFTKQELAEAQLLVDDANNAVAKKAEREKQEKAHSASQMATIPEL